LALWLWYERDDWFLLPNAQGWRTTTNEVVELRVPLQALAALYVEPVKQQRLALKIRSHDRADIPAQ
jgi:hypothetical protein